MSRSQVPRKSAAKRCRCGESRRDAMARQGRWPCYECVSERAGKKRTEEHHPFGRNIPAFAGRVVETPGNWHRVLHAQDANRPEVLKRPGENPLHQIAAIVVTLGEAADAVANYGRREGWPEWVANLGELFSQVAHLAADWLLILAGQLDEKLGSSWAEQLGMPPPWQP
jgi:hypothetical protein